MRHGRSLANEAELIVSSLNQGSEHWGLAEGSQKQISDSVASSGLPKELTIVSSPFLRARETAQIVSKLLKMSPVRIEEGLRERFFGKWDGVRDDSYREVWVSDERNPDNRNGGVESPSDVLKRVLEVLERIEASDGPDAVLLVSHGDPLNILLAHAAGLGAENHRRIDGMKTAEIRPLCFEGASSLGK